MLVFRKILCWTMSHHMQLKKKQQQQKKNKTKQNVDSDSA